MIWGCNVSTNNPNRHNGMPQPTRRLQSSATTPRVSAAGRAPSINHSAIVLQPILPDCAQQRPFDPKISAEVVEGLNHEPAHVRQSGVPLLRRRGGVNDHKDDVARVDCYIPNDQGQRWVSL